MMYSYFVVPMKDNHFKERCKTPDNSNVCI